jgi:hypothetical protein
LIVAEYETRETKNMEKLKEKEKTGYELEK